MIPALLIFALVVIGLLAVVLVMVLFVQVHRTLNRLCVRHARRFCERSHLEISRIRFQPAFDQSGIKTEFTLVQLDCRDAQQQRKLVVMVVWPFGVRKILSNENYPDSFDENWPQSGPTTVPG